jgi:GTP pyrophosphokinase
VKFARCCHPLPGDQVVAYITRAAVREGKDYRAGGLTVHRIDCSNVPRDLTRAPEPDRWLRAHWGDTARAEYRGAFTIQTLNLRGMTATVSTLLNNLHVDIDEFQSHNNKDGTGSIYAVIGVNSREQLESLRGKLYQIKGVTEVEV